MQKVLELPAHTIAHNCFLRATYRLPGNKKGPRETKRYTSHTVGDVNGLWLVPPGILWWGASTRETTPALSQASKKDASSRLPNLSYPISWNTQKWCLCYLPPEITSLRELMPQPCQHAEGEGLSSPAHLECKVAPWCSSQRAWENRSRRVLASGSRDSGNWVKESLYYSEPLGEWQTGAASSRQRSLIISWISALMPAHS